MTAIGIKEALRTWHVAIFDVCEIDPLFVQVMYMTAQIRLQCQ
jgi:hypothetical protein